MKKILIFVDSFLPGFKGGGPITSIANLVDLLNDSFDILICTKNHDFKETKSYTEVESNKVTKYLDYKVIYLSQTNKVAISNVINEYNPDILYLNSFFSKITQIVMFLNKLYFHKKLVVAPRGELQENALSIKKTKKMLYLKLYKFLRLYKNIVFHSTDDIETESIRNLFNINKVIQLSNAVKLYSFDPLIKAKNGLKLIFVSRISKKKNLLFALEILRNIDIDITFDIYGPKEDIEYWNKCNKIIKELPNTIIVNYKGCLKQSEIISVMRGYNAFFFPTLSENFGHVIVEAMQSGIVPIISDQTPWIDLEKYNAGYDIPLNNKKKFIETIKKLYYMDKEEYQNLSLNTMRYIKNKLNIEQLKLDYIKFFNNIMEK